MKGALRSNSVMNDIRRAHWSVPGLKDEAMEKPKIATVNSYSNVAICFSHLDEIAKKMREAVLIEASLGFLGLGIDPPQRCIGVVVYDGYISTWWCGRYSFQPRDWLSCLLFFFQYDRRWGARRSRPPA